MKIRGTETLSHPAREVFETLRDKTQDLVAIMPNIESMEVLERVEEPPDVRLVNKWQGAKGDVPAIVRPFVSRKLLAWDDFATWNEERLDCTWRIQAGIGKDVFSCHGHTVIAPTGERSCTFTLEGEMSIDPAKVPGVPGFMARKVKEPIERFIAGAMEPNLTSIAGAVQRYLDGKRG